MCFADLVPSSLERAFAQGGTMRGNGSSPFCGWLTFGTG
jgi:hypothetical protein